MTESAPRTFNDIDLIEHATLREACLHMAEDAAHVLAKCIARQGGAFVAVPGGTSPEPFFEAMSQKTIYWSKVRITLTDERWVSEDSNESNARLVRHALLRNQAEAAIFTPPQTMQTSLHDAAAAWDASLRQAQPFDLVVLGMGEDGHFASLFPGDANLAANLDPKSDALAVAIADRAPQRLSLTLRAVTRAKRLMLLVSGEKKRAVLTGASSGDASAADLPIFALLRASPITPTCYWGALS